MIKTKTIAKKVLSLILSMVMMFSCFAALGLIEASAATAGSYYYKITWKVVSGNNLDNTYVRKGAETNDCCGISLFYKNTNGTDETVNEKAHSLSHIVKQYNGGNASPMQYVTGSVSGFPYELYMELDDNRAGGATKVEIYSIEVGSSSTNLRTVWTGTGHLDSTSELKWITINQTLQQGNDNKYAKVTTNTRDWPTPAPTAITGLTDREYTLSKTTAEYTTPTITGIVKDQYGVSWYQKPTTYTLTNEQNRSVPGATLTNSGDGTTIKFTKDVLATTNGYNSLTGFANLTLKAAIGSVNATCTIKVKSDTYYVKFYNGDNTILDTKSCYYGGSIEPTADATKAHTDAIHFTFTGWSDTSYVNIRADKSVNPQFRSEAHSYVYQSLSSTQHRVTCSGCTFTKDENHTINTSTTSPNCVNPGSTVNSCTKCDFSSSTPIPALGHNFTGAIVMKSNGQNGEHYYRCINSGCLALGVGTTLGATQPHRWNSGEIIKNPTCTATGEKKFTCIDNCDATYIETIPANGHTLNKVDAVASTCTTKGNIEYYKCSVCLLCFRDAQGTQSILEAETITDFKPHSWTLLSRTDSTCGLSGFEVYKCDDCEIEDTRPLPLDESLHEFTVEATGTDYVHTAATCGVDAVYYRSCVHCQKSSAGYETESTFTVPNTALTHSYNLSSLKAYCSQVGTSTYTCINCGDSYNQNVPATGVHVYGEWETVRPASCGVDGLEKRTCTTCELYQERPIDVPPHKYNVTNDFTCPEGGTQRFTCTLCGYSEVITIEAGSEHTFSDWRMTVASTCNTPTIEQRDCLICAVKEKRYTAPDGHIDENLDGICDVCGKTEEMIADEKPYDPENPEANFEGGTAPDGNGSGGNGSGGNNSGGNGSGGGNTTQEVRCSFCDTYERYQGMAVTGAIYSVIHMIIHFFQTFKFFFV